MDIDVLGIDLAKRVFQLHGVDRRGQAQHRSKVSRASLLGAVRELRPRRVVMEACSSAHHWGRCFQSLGIEVRLVSPQCVSPFVKTNKNDRNVAEAIVEAACRPAMRFVTVKSVEQQDMQAAHRIRELLVHRRTALINQVRGLLGERGITIARSPEATGCFVDARRVEGGAQRRAALENPEDRVWVGLSSSPRVEAVARPAAATLATPNVRFESAAATHSGSHRVTGLAGR